MFMQSSTLCLCKVPLYVYGKFFLEISTKFLCMISQRSSVSLGKVPVSVNESSFVCLY